MKLISRCGALLLLQLCMLCSLSAFPVERVLKLHILEKETKNPLPMAYVYAVGKYYTLDMEGNCHIRYEENTSDSLVVSCIGFKTYAVGLKQIPPGLSWVVKMEVDNQQLSEVVIRGVKPVTPPTSVSAILKKDAIRRGMGGTLSALLEQVGGVSSISTGATVAKPVIHGMYGNRIVVVNNGVRQEGQQWGDDHAPELDMNTAGSITVVKGADAVRYGPEALGGTILLEPRPLPYGQNRIHGMLSTLYGLNGQRTVSTGVLESGVSFLPGMAWRVQGTYANGGDRKTAHYLLNNTGYREKDFSAELGYNHSKYGVGVYYSRYESKLGVFYGSQMGDVELLKERIALGRPVDVLPFSRHIDYPYQQVTHHLLKEKAFWTPGNWGTLKLQYAYQTDYRDEFHLRRNNRSGIPSLSLTLESHQADVSWQHAYAGRWNTEIGGHYGYADNANIPGTGVVPVIPNYIKEENGLFAIQHFSHGRLEAEAGLRFDYQKTNAAGIDMYSRHYGGKRTFSNFTYNAGVRYLLGETLAIRSQLGMAWRAPHVYELYSNGLDHGSGMYVIGDSTLRSEKSTKWITSLMYKSRKLDVTADFYLQWIRDFIYDAPMRGEYRTLVSGAYPVFRYRQTTAYFRGADLTLAWHILPTLHYRFTGSMVFANERETGHYLPYIPSPRFDSSFRWGLTDWKCLHRNWLLVGYRFVSKQTRFNRETDLTDHSPDAYGLWHMEAGTQIPLPGTASLDVLLAINNVFNKEYKEYTNRFRYYAHDMGRDVRVSVTWNF